MNLQFTNYAKINPDKSGYLLLESEWQNLRRQLSPADLANLNRGEAVKYQDCEIRKTTKGNSNG